jgi:hypothetical protein
VNEGSLGAGQWVGSGVRSQSQRESTASDDAFGGRSKDVISTPPTMTTLGRGATMADKSPSHHNEKKVGKSLKEKRNEKHSKKETKKIQLSE